MLSLSQSIALTVGLVQLRCNTSNSKSTALPSARPQRYPNPGPYPMPICPSPKPNPSLNSTLNELAWGRVELTATHTYS